MKAYGNYIFIKWSERSPPRAPDYVYTLRKGKLSSPEVVLKLLVRNRPCMCEDMGACRNQGGKEAAPPYRFSRLLDLEKIKATKVCLPTWQKHPPTLTVRLQHLQSPTSSKYLCINRSTSSEEQSQIDHSKQLQNTVLYQASCLVTGSNRMCQG